MSLSLSSGEIERVLYGLAHAVLALALAGTDDGGASVFQGGAHIGKVEVYLTVLRHQFGNAAGRVGQGVVGLGEGVGPREVGIDFAQTARC